MQNFPSGHGAPMRDELRKTKRPNGRGLALGVAAPVMEHHPKKKEKQYEHSRSSVQRVTLVSTQPSDAVIARIDAQIGHPDLAAFRKAFSAARMELKWKSSSIR